MKKSNKEHKTEERRIGDIIFQVRPRTKPNPWFFRNKKKGKETRARRLFQLRLKRGCGFQPSAVWLCKLEGLQTHLHFFPGSHNPTHHHHVSKALD